MIRHIFNQVGFSRSALAAAFGIPFLIASSAFAQNPPAPAAGTATTDRVIVTGSYIPTAETESALPVTVYTAAVLQKQGANTPVEGLRQLPSFVGNAATENDSNGGNGQANINLRALGSQNTLTLINGRRAFQFSDINAIAIGSLARTEVLKDGASAVYGSDAVAGVVNFILLDGPGEAPYQGAEVFALYGNTTETDAHVRQFYLKGGVATDKVSVAAAGEYYSRANLFSVDRAKLAGSANLTNQPGVGLQRGGQNTNSPTFAGRVRLSNGPGMRALQLVIVNPNQVSPVATTNGTNPAGYRNFEVLPGTAGTDPSRFNFRAFTPAIPAVEKAMYFVTGRYKIFGEGLQIYGDVLYSKTKQDNGLAAAPFSSSQLQTTGYTPDPSGNGLALTGFKGGEVARASQFNPFRTVGSFAVNPITGASIDPNRRGVTQFRYRFVNDLGLRKSFYDSDYYRYVGGLNGDFNLANNGFISHFGYDTGFVFERYDNQRTDSGDARGMPLADEIIAGNFNPYIGQSAPVAGTALIYNNQNPLAPNYHNGVSIGTAPYDNRAAATRASYLGHSFFYEADWLADAKANAHLFPNLYNGGIDIAVGYEHRESRTHQVPDPVQVAGDQLGFNAAPNTKYRQEVSSYFGEITIPLITSTMNVPFVRSLEVSAAFRYEEFDNFDLFHQNPLASHIGFNNGGTPRVSLRYQPFADLTLRASWGQSFRSPGPATLFDPGSQNFPNVFDLLKFNVLQPPQGVDQRGNIALVPENTDSYSAGLVYTPKFLPNFTMTADWYQLFTNNVILGAAEFAQIMLTQNGLSGLRNVVGGVPTPTVFVSDGTTQGIVRDAANNVQSIQVATTANAGKRLVEGLDVTARYEIPTQNFGTFAISGGWNHFFIWKAEALPGLGSTNFLGNYNNGTIPLAPGAIPFNKGFLRGEWSWKGLEFVSTLNYIGDFEDDAAFVRGNGVNSVNQNFVFPNSTVSNPTFRLHHRVSAYETLDLQLSYEFLKPQIEPIAAGKDFSKDGKSMAPAVAGVESSSIFMRMLWNTKVTVGVNNAFDRYPPTVLGAFNDNYDTSLYSIRNRYWYVSLAKKF